LQGLQTVVKKKATKGIPELSSCPTGFFLNPEAARSRRRSIYRSLGVGIARAGELAI